MNLKSNLPSRILSRQFPASALALTLLLANATSLLGQGAYITTNSFDGISLLPPPPIRGSAEEVADLASVRAVFNGRTESEKARAIKDSGLSFSLFQSPVGATFDLDKLPKTKALLEKVKKEIGPIIDASKNHFKRLRPYQIDDHLVLGPPEPSCSYPSGHSTRGTVYSLVVAELFPEKKDAVLEIGRDIGWDRVLIGKHFPTDIYAGRVLGYAIVRELHSNTLFQHDLEQAMAEVREAEHHLVPAEIAK